MRVALATLLIIAVGVFSRMPTAHSLGVPKEFGDILWATMFYLLVLLARPTTRPLFAGLIALAVCIAIEFFKLVHSPWIDSLRAGPLGYLLGHDFYWHDLFCYLLGTSIGLLIAKSVALAHRPTHPRFV